MFNAHLNPWYIQRWNVCWYLLSWTVIFIDYQKDWWLVMTGTLADCSDFSTNNLNIIYFKILILEQRFVFILFSIRKSFLMESINQSFLELNQDQNQTLSYHHWHWVSIFKVVTVWMYCSFAVTVSECSGKLAVWLLQRSFA